MHIDRCYCFKKTFAELKAAAEEHDVHTVDELQKHVEFGQNCRLCHPYVRRMLRTGQTSFEQILREEDEPLER